jgi:hypothetical protein
MTWAMIDPFLFYIFFMIHYLLESIYIYNSSGADDVVTEFVDMCKIVFIHGRDVGSR